MNNEQLKEYIRRAKELESAIYTQKELMTRHNELLYSQMPSKPQPPSISNHPYQPSEPQSSIAGIFFAIVIGIFFCAGGIFCNNFLATVFCLIIGALAFLAVVIWINEDKKAKSSYNERYIRYQENLKKYKEDMAKAESSYQESLKSFDDRSNKYKQLRANYDEQHKSALAALTNALADHYSLNIVFEKYRNIVAISAIDEYLSSGRCEKLEGPDGAYNLYEMELRQNIIIGQLSSIVDNLEKIKENQYTLYQELSKANATVNSILTELKDIRKDTQLTAHMSYVTAVAATAPRYTYTLP